MHGRARAGAVGGHALPWRNLAGDAEFRRGGPGGSVGYFGGWLGFELDVQRYHHFFKDQNVDLVPNNCVPTSSMPCIDLNTDAMSFMGNVVAFAQGGEVAPLRRSRTRRYSRLDRGSRRPVRHRPERPGSRRWWGRDRSLSTRLALRGDLRYSAFVDESERGGAYFKDYGFVRATLGVTFGFPAVIDPLRGRA